MRKALVVTACIVALILGVIYNFWQDGTKPNFGIIPFVLFGLAFIAGLIRRFIVAYRSGNPKRSFEPLRDANTTFENLVLGRKSETDPRVIQHHVQSPFKDPAD